MLAPTYEMFTGLVDTLIDNAQQWEKAEIGSEDERRAKDECRRVRNLILDAYRSFR